METKQKYLRDIRDAINGVETVMPGVAGESEATYLRDIAKAIRSSGIDPSIPKVTDADNGKVLKVVNGVWAKAEEEGVLYGENAPAANVGKDGDVYVQYEIKQSKKDLVWELDEPYTINDYKNSLDSGGQHQVLGTGIIGEIGKIYYAELSVDVEDPVDLESQYGWTHIDAITIPTKFASSSSEWDASHYPHYVVNGIRALPVFPDSVVPSDCQGSFILDIDNLLSRSSYQVATVSNNFAQHIRDHEGLDEDEIGIAVGYVGVQTLLTREVRGREPGTYSRTFTDIKLYEVEYESSLTDIYLKVNGEWVKDNFGKDEEPEQPESISLLHLDEDFVNDQITDAKGITYSLMTGSTGISMTNETKKFGDKCLKMTGNGWVNSEILGNKLDFKNGDFTIDLWVRPSDTWRMCPICLPGNGLLIDLNNGIARIWFVNEAGQLVVHADGGGNGFGTIPVPANVWTHIAYVREGDYVALFVNGKLDIFRYIGFINKQYIPELSGICLGNWDNGDSALYTYSGYIDEVRVTNKAMWHIFDNIPTEPYTK